MILSDQIMKCSTKGAALRKEPHKTALLVDFKLNVSYLVNHLEQ